MKHFKLLALVIIASFIIIATVAAQTVSPIAGTQTIVEIRQSATDNLFYIACIQDCDHYFYALDDIANLHFGFSTEYAAHTYYMSVYSDFFGLAYVPLPPPPNP